ncbi:hypothetical protein ISCGN_026521 [Ixodes scapularis]
MPGEVSELPKAPTNPAYLAAAALPNTANCATKGNDAHSSAMTTNTTPGANLGQATAANCTQIQLTPTATPRSAQVPRRKRTTARNAAENSELKKPKRPEGRITKTDDDDDASSVYTTSTAMERGLERTSGYNAEISSNEGAWTEVQKRKRNIKLPLQVDTRPRYNVIFCPRTRIDITTLRSKAIREQLLGICGAETHAKMKDHFHNRLNAKTNTVAVTVWKEEHARRLLGTRGLKTGGNPEFVEVVSHSPPYEGTTRGVLRGIDQEESESTLLQTLECRTHEILDARRLGKNGAILITFQGTRSPRHLVYNGRVMPVARYRPTTMSIGQQLEEADGAAPDGQVELASDFRSGITEKPGLSVSPAGNCRPEIMRWRQLRLLLWKSVYLYKLRRNWIITALEVITPLLLTSVQVYLHCRRQSQAEVRPPSIGPTNRTFNPDAPVTLMPSLLAFPRVLGFVPAPGPANETGETLLRDAFSGIGLELEEFPDESRLVENLTRHKNALGLANNYGVVFLRAGDGMLSYVLRFPSWQEFYTRETRTTSDSERMPQYWLYGEPPS